MQADCRLTKLRVSLDRFLRKNLSTQIQDVKKNIINIAHPRVILGANNLSRNNHLSGVDPFLNNPNDILASDEQKDLILLDRTLKFNFNDLVAIKELSEAFPETFDIITADFYVAKFMHWTKEHLNHFKTMLKPSGKIVLPLNNNNLAPLSGRIIKDNEEFLHLQGDYININMIGDIDGVEFPYLCIEVFKKDREFCLESLEKSGELNELNTLTLNFISFLKEFDMDKNKRNEMREKMKKMGIENLDSFLDESDEMINHIKSRPFVTNRWVITTYLDIKRKSKSDLYMMMIIKFNIKRIAEKVFDEDKIEINKNMPLPQPHRKAT